MTVSNFLHPVYAQSDLLLSGQVKICQGPTGGMEAAPKPNGATTRSWGMRRENPWRPFASQYAMDEPYLINLLQNYKREEISTKL